MEFMRDKPDKYYDLAIVDPPYGIGIGKTTNTQGKNRRKRKINKYEKKDWDNQRPTIEYWNELNRVSKNQIVFGANYFVEYLKPTKGWIFWNKKNGCPSFSDGEFVYTSFDKVAKMYTLSSVVDSNGGIDRIHPTEKPQDICQRIIKASSNENDNVLIPFAGSGSEIVACEELKRNWIAFEIEDSYIEIINKRLDEFKTKLF